MIEQRQTFIAIRRPEARRGRPRRPSGAAAFDLGTDFHATAGAALEEEMGLEEGPVADRVGDRSERGNYHELPGIGAVIVEPTAATTAEEVVSTLGDEYLVMPDFEVGLPDTAAQGLAAPPVPSDAVLPLDQILPEDVGVFDRHKAGNKGEGVVIAVLDTGVDADHGEFAGQMIDFGYAPPGGGRVRDDRRGFDTGTHGTHVCGILRGRNIGLAPEAQLLCASVIESESVATSASRVIEALQWVQRRCGEPAYDNKPVILSMSLGFTPESLEKAHMDTTMEALRGLLQDLRDTDDILTVVAIGNEGANRVRAPGFYPEALSVGAVGYDRTSWAKSGGGFAPAPFQTRMCPDIAGFGVKVVSATGRDPMGASWYGEKSGTSMAAPYVAGIAALIAADSGDVGEELRQAVIGQALPLPGLDAQRVGQGLARCA